MNAKKCDRCGKLYEYYKCTNDVGANAIVLYRTKQDAEDFNDLCYSPKDLCKECMDSFVKWYEMKGE